MNPKTLAQSLPPATRIEEYCLQSVLGIGAFGITYLAMDENLALQVAIKEYFPSSAAVRDPATGAVALRSSAAQKEFEWGRDRFMLEAQTLARFRHKNIVPVFRYLKANDTCYMVMAYEAGTSLEQALRDEATVWEEANTLALILPLLDGLESVHQAGFLHRDIKPGNIVLRANGDGPVLIDFGAARSTETNSELTIVLSHGYGPPEQYSRNGEQGPWTDIYAMAGVLYRIVAGSVPQMSIHRVSNDVVIPATFAGDGRFSQRFLSAIDLALSLDKTRRPQSVREWREQLTGQVVAPSAPRPAASSPPGSASATDRMAAAHTVVPSPVSQALNPPKPATHRPVGPTTARPSAARPLSHHDVDEEESKGLLGTLAAIFVAHPFLILFLAFGGLGVLIYNSYSAKQAAAKASPAAVAAPAAPQATPVAPQAIPDIPEPTPMMRSEPLPVTAVTATTPRAPEPEPPVEPAPSSERQNPDRRRSFLLDAQNACAGLSVGAACSVTGPRGHQATGRCSTGPAGALACKPDFMPERGDSSRGGGFRPAPGER